MIFRPALGRTWSCCPGNPHIPPPSSLSLWLLPPPHHGGRLGDGHHPRYGSGVSLSSCPTSQHSCPPTPWALRRLVCALPLKAGVPGPRDPLGCALQALMSGWSPEPQAPLHQRPPRCPNPGPSPASPQLPPLSPRRPVSQGASQSGWVLPVRLQMRPEPPLLPSPSGLGPRCPQLRPLHASSLAGPRLPLCPQPSESLTWAPAGRHLKPTCVLPIPSALVPLPSPGSPWSWPCPPSCPPNPQALQTWHPLPGGRPGAAPLLRGCGARRRGMPGLQVGRLTSPSSSWTCSTYVVPLRTGPAAGASDWSLPLSVLRLWSCVSLSDSSAFSLSDLSENPSFSRWFSREDPFSLEGGWPLVTGGPLHPHPGHPSPTPLCLRASGMGT